MPSRWLRGYLGLREGVGAEKAGFHAPLFKLEGLPLLTALHVELCKVLHEAEYHESKCVAVQMGLVGGGTGREEQGWDGSGAPSTSTGPSHGWSIKGSGMPSLLVSRKVASLETNLRPSAAPLLLGTQAPGIFFLHLRGPQDTGRGLPLRKSHPQRRLGITTWA